MSVSFLTNPFDEPRDPKKLPAYGSPSAAIGSVLYNNVKTIFSYKTFSDPDLLDNCLKKWATKDDSDVFYQELDIRAGAGLAPLGYARSLPQLNGAAQVVGIVAPGYALPYFVNTFQKSERADVSFFFSVGALNYDEKSSSIGSDYVTALDAAAKLGFPVVTPVSSHEVQAVSLLALALAKFGNNGGALNLFDGPHYAKSISEFREKAIEGELLNKLEKLLPRESSFESVLQSFNEVTGLRLHNFEYDGSSKAETIFVTYGSVESEVFRNAIKYHGDEANVAVISVRVPLPFDLEKFVTRIPQTAKKIVVVGQSLDCTSSTLLRRQVSAALFYHGNRSVSVSEYIYEPSFVWSPSAVEQIVETFVPGFKSSLTDLSTKSFIFWASDKSPIIDLSSRLVHALSLVDGQTVTLRTKYDNIVNAGAFQAQFTTSPSTEGAFVSNIEQADVAIVENIALLDSLQVAATVKKNGTILLVGQKSLKGQDARQLESYVKTLGISESFFKTAHDKQIKVVVIDAEAIGDRDETKGRTLSFVIQAAFWKYAYGYDVAESVRRIWNSAGTDLELLAAVLSDIISSALEEGVAVIPHEAYSAVEDVSKEEEDSKSASDLPIFLTETSFRPNNTSISELSGAQSASDTDISKRLVFSEAYGVEKRLRPDLPVKNYVVRVKENKRVTPSDYDRNIFQIEFDIEGSGMKYEIGEALGVHARNNEAQVKEFLASYGLKENDVIQVANKDQPEILESRTVLQAFIENLDIFGKPPKKFYESLIDFATDEDEKKELQEIVSEPGSVRLKRYQDVEFYTYADIFDLFPSVRPCLEDLVTIIAPLKRREYSIASSQKIHKNEVHLLIVVVEWLDNKGRKRFGQASKYLSDLRVGSELVVSVKPSVMKLPPNPEQPVIMSGLGTGLAPFKAIVEEKLWQRQQGYDIGDVYLYLGSRHKREEYLYGELWEAYKDAGIITHIGAAFSRDQPQKIYIQDRIKENLKELKVAMIDQVGSFYLCGPTWPVPDITQALKDILAADAEERDVKIDLNAEIEELKESSRYILEVY
ncbi:hypothetical protein HG536_0C04340 [Torulaspora globosa]|uniref:assimilatory sulfite reductase (NADPH) n=1 Tax=Torulaspora globosa TaxID=48254 RepID=A0A7G3ZFH9_9SACH|nr:uncharacterized protein HG536_0C04340 [Torulaspora globosa]QLL32265.1 hypothetical protein HG536_0C04340 [Torulaspora globosa]